MQQSTDLSYKFAIELLDGDKVVGRRELGRADFQRAIFTTAFEGFRKGLCPSYVLSPERAAITPRWKEADQTERALGFRVELSVDSGAPHSLDFGIGYFRPAALTLRGKVKQQSATPIEQPLLYRLICYSQDDASPNRGVGMTFDSATLQTPICETPMEQLRPIESWDEPTPNELPVYIRRSVIDDLLSFAAASPDREVGGILLGRLHRDPAHADVFVEITCLVLGGDTTIGDRASVTFTPETFALARRMIALRADQGFEESILGWAHSHPFRFCSSCPTPTPAECVDKVLFFSGEDVLVMAGTFAQPFMIGLLAGIDPKLEAAVGHPPVRLFGWRAGEVGARGFHVIEG